MFFYELSINLFHAVLKQRSLQGPVTFAPNYPTVCILCVASPGSTSDQVYQEGPLWSTTMEGEGIRTGRSNRLPWILTKFSDDPTGNSEIAVALQGSLKMRWGVKSLYFPLGQVIRLRFTGEVPERGGDFGLGCSHRRGIFGEGLRWGIQPAASLHMLVPKVGDVGHPPQRSTVVQQNLPVSPPWLPTQ